MPCTSATASRPETLPESRRAVLLRMVASLSPVADAADAFICAMICRSYGVRLGTASALAISAMASRALRCLNSDWAACRGLPTSGRAPSPFAWASASKLAEAPSMRPAHRTACRALRIIPALLVEELLGADQPDLRDPEALGRGHHVRHMLVRNELVGPQVHFGLHRLRRGGAEAVVERGPVDLLAVPEDGAVRIDVDLHALGWRGRRRRVADRHVELHRVRLDRDGDDEHDQQHQHHVDQGRGVDVDHHLGIALAATAYGHCHCSGSFALHSLATARPAAADR